MFNTRLRFVAVILIAVLATGPALAIMPRAYAQEDPETELFLVAQKAFEDGFYDVAMRYINQLFEEYPRTEKKVEAKLLLGQCYFFKSQYLKAYDTFHELLDYNEYKDATLFWLGETYLKGAEYAKAEDQYKQLINLYPDSDYTPQAHYSLGWTYFSQNNFKKARESFGTLIKNYPVHQLAEDASFKLAECDFHLNNYENAIENFKSYILNNPQSRRHAQAYFYIAESYYFLENYLTAVTYYAKAAEIAYDNKLILMAKTSLGWSYLKLEKFKLAQQYFNEAYQFARDKGILTDDVLLGQATFFAEINNPNEALKAYKQLINKFPDSERIIEAYMGLANTYYQKQEYEHAIANYKTTIERATGDKERTALLEKAYFGLAWAYLKSGDIDMAVKSFETIKNTTASNTTKISAMTQIGDAYQDIGQYDKAVQFYDKILKDYPDSPYTDYVQYRQGIALLKMEKIEAATLSFQTLQSNFPSSKYINDVRYYLAVAYFKKDEWARAKSHILEFIDGLPKSNQFLAEAHYILALCHYNLKEFNEALKAFNVIINDFSSETNLVKNSEFYLAKTYFDMGSPGEALKRFENIVSRYPKTKVAEDSLMWLGDYHLEESKFKNAIAYYKKLINMFPGSSNRSLIFFEMGRAYQALGEYDRAVDSFQQIKESEDQALYQKTRLAIADIFARDLDSDDAIQTYQNIINDHPEFTRSASIKIAKLYSNMNNYQEAVAAYERALKAEKTTDEHSDAELQFLIADGYQLLHQHEKAVDEYLKVSYLYPKEIPWVIKSYLRMARIFEDDEQWDNAEITYKKIVGFDTDESKFAKERLEWISEHILP